MYFHCFREETFRLKKMKKTNPEAESGTPLKINVLSIKHSPPVELKGGRQSFASSLPAAVSLDSQQLLRTDPVFTAKKKKKNPDVLRNFSNHCCSISRLSVIMLSTQKNLAKTSFHLNPHAQCCQTCRLLLFHFFAVHEAEAVFTLMQIHLKIGGRRDSTIWISSSSLRNAGFVWMTDRNKQKRMFKNWSPPDTIMGKHGRDVRRYNHTHSAEN